VRWDWALGQNRLPSEGDEERGYNGVARAHSIVAVRRVFILKRNSDPRWRRGGCGWSHFATWFRELPGSDSRFPFSPSRMIGTVREASGEPREPSSRITERDSSLGHRTIVWNMIWSSDRRRGVKVTMFIFSSL
jgi:hypothetical protein